MDARRHSALLVALLLTLAPLAAQEAPAVDALAPVGTSTTYQGRLMDGETAAAGSYDLRFTLWTDAAGGTPVGTVNAEDVAVFDGVFTVALDFGAGAFNPEARWLAVAVRPAISTGTFTDLVPRQPLQPAPYAHWSRAGVATEVACTGCVGATDLGAGEVQPGHLDTASPPADGAVLAYDGVSMDWTTPAVGADGVTGLVAGGVGFGGSGGELTQDASHLFWDAATHRLGLGTAAPAEQLHLTGNLRLPAGGQLLLGPARFLHAAGVNSTFLGGGAGNLLATGIHNTGVGAGSLALVGSGSANTALGTYALTYATTGSDNTAVGSSSLLANTIGAGNVAVGSGALAANTAAGRNTAVGTRALAAQVGGSAPGWWSDNTAVGYEALQANRAMPGLDQYGVQNTAVGALAMRQNALGNRNSALGWAALEVNDGGYNNTAVGVEAMRANIAGIANTAVGSGSLGANTSGWSNTAVGAQSLASNSTASGSTAVGVGALNMQAYDGGLAFETLNTGVGLVALFATNPTSDDNGRENTAVGALSLQLNTLGAYNVAAGVSALGANTTAAGNTAVGTRALALQSFNNHGATYDAGNTAVGYEALFSNQPGEHQGVFIAGVHNTALGSLSLRDNTSGTRNTAVGSGALLGNREGAYNTSVGYRSLAANNGPSNTAVGALALEANTGGPGNTAVGTGALWVNTTAGANTAVGSGALEKQSFANGDTVWWSHNTAVGANALRFNQPTSSDNGRDNTAVGSAAMVSNQAGFANAALGVESMSSNTTGSWNVALGMQALAMNTTGNGNIAIGHTAGAGWDGNNRLFIGNGLGTIVYGNIETKQVGIGTESPTAALDVNGTIRSRALAAGSVCADASGVLGSCGPSDARLKTDVRDLAAELDVLEAVARLRGVTFAWDQAQERGRRQGDRREVGLIAQEVEAVLPEVVAVDGDGFRTLDYARLTALLVEAAKAQQAEIAAQQAEIAQQRARLAEQQTELAAQRRALEEQGRRLDALARALASRATT